MAKVALRAFLEHARRTPSVSFMRRGDIARWWLEQYPPTGRDPGSWLKPATVFDQAAPSNSSA